jgi:hypothetical protein
MDIVSKISAINRNKMAGEEDAESNWLSEFKDDKPEQEPGRTYGKEGIDTFAHVSPYGSKSNSPKNP